MNKPVVRYKIGTPCHIVAGLPALVHPVDHPNHLPEHNVSNTKYVLTSTVLRVGENGEFETRNTIYRPEELNGHPA